MKFLLTSPLPALIFSGCSFFGPSTQTYQVVTEPEGAEVRINGMLVGESPWAGEISRSNDVVVEVRKAGYQPQLRTSNRTLSGLGTVDVLGGAVWLVPFLGLLSSAAWEHDPGAATFYMDREISEDAGGQAHRD